MPTPEKDVTKFLKDLKNIIVGGRGLDVIPRKANVAALVQLNMTESNRRQEILSLSTNDYCSGPTPDSDRLGDVWVFGKKIMGKQVYIKLKISVIEGTPIAKCLSFHEATYPLRFPYQKTDEEGRN